MHNAQDMTEEKWIADCAARFKERLKNCEGFGEEGFDDKFCQDQGEICFDNVERDLSEDPASCADEELSNWTDDGD